MMNEHIFTRVAALVVCVATGLPFAAARGADVEPSLSSADLHADALVLRRAYEALHPGLYRYDTPDETDRHFAGKDSCASRSRRWRGGQRRT